ncbi:MAG: FkbM family methyltransferase [Gammaproteobacteria bacterium]|nr:MAG: FkbM family methyltransferase [Gammaproteobacteria bacterium]
MNLLASLSRLAKARRDRRRRPEVNDFILAAAALEAGDIAIDCGANVGLYTVKMAASGARVFAFEPDPAAYAKLVQATREYPNVTVYQAAVTTQPGPVKLYLHKWAEQDPVYWSTGSSLLESKNNIRKDRYIEVEAVMLAEFIEGLEGRVKLLKMDIEGAEVDVLNQLLERGLHSRIDAAFVEVHDRRVAALRAPTQQLRERLEKLQARQFRLDWR